MLAVLEWSSSESGPDIFMIWDFRKAGLWRRRIISHAIIAARNTAETPTATKTPATVAGLENSEFE